MRVVILHNDDFAHLQGAERLSQDAVLDVVEAIAAALRGHGHEATAIPIATPGALLASLERLRPDLAVNLCESLAGDARGEALVPELLERQGVPCTGSDGFALALALRKPKAKEILVARGVPTPPFAVIERLADLESLALPFPLIVKPAHEDASIGIDHDSVASDRKTLRRACARVLEAHRQPALVERYIEGRELAVALLGDPPEPLPIGEIDFSSLPLAHPRIVTYAAKWEEDSFDFRATPPIPCALEPEIRLKVETVARAAFAALMCRDYGRVDLRLGDDGVPYVIEVNPNCDLTPTAGFARAAAAAGIAYEALVERLIALALARAEPLRRRTAS